MAFDFLKQIKSNKTNKPAKLLYFKFFTHGIHNKT